MGPTIHKHKQQQQHSLFPLYIDSIANSLYISLSKERKRKRKKASGFGFFDLPLSSSSSTQMTLQIFNFLLFSLLSTPRLFISGVLSSATFTIVNKCDHAVWPGILSNAGISPLPTTGFSLQKGESRTINAPSSWGGRFWGRTHCTQDSTGIFTCLTGDCGSGKLECSGSGATPPATLAEFTLDGDNGLDFFDVSLVDGYNLPMLVVPVPQGGNGVNCTNTGCVVDLNGACPSEMKVMSSGGEGVACKSACEAFGDDEYCCSGAYGSPDTCKPSSYSEVFKKACPRAYSYAYDDKTSTFTCAAADYLITFCPKPNTSQKSSSNGTQWDGGMIYEGATDMTSGSSRSTFRSLAAVGVMAALVTFMRMS